MIEPRAGNRVNRFAIVQPGFAIMAELGWSLLAEIQGLPF
jgi:hypothetical protein